MLEIRRLQWMRRWKVLEDAGIACGRWRHLLGHRNRPTRRARPSVPPLVELLEIDLRCPQPENPRRLRPFMLEDSLLPRRRRLLAPAAPAPASSCSSCCCSCCCCCSSPLPTRRRRSPAWRSPGPAPTASSRATVRGFGSLEESTIATKSVGAQCKGSVVATKAAEAQ